MHKVARTNVAIVLASLVLVPFTLAQPGHPAHAKTSSSSMESVIVALWAGKTFHQTAISPDGKQVAWVEITKDGSAIFISATTGGTPAASPPADSLKAQSHGLPTASRWHFFLTPPRPASLSFMSLTPPLGRRGSLPA